MISICFKNIKFKNVSLFIVIYLFIYIVILLNFNDMVMEL